MDHLLPWLILKQTPGIGDLLFKRLIDAFKTPQAVLDATEATLCRVEGVSHRLAKTIQAQRLTDAIKQEIDSIESSGCRVLLLTASDYPPLLKEIPDPPPLLYAFGDTGETRHCIAMVGSRNAGAYGIAAARQLSRELTQFGLVVVSGLALGIDTAAHEGALAGGGRTLAILGSGLLRLYPKGNQYLAKRIIENGAVLSEFPLSANPEPHHFPIRNRVISGICLGTIVVEAAAKSGALITARLALEQNREVFAVPGSIGSPRNSGCHGLIKQGATLIESATDVIAELGPRITLHTPQKNLSPSPKPPMPTLSPEEARVFSSLTASPVHIDEISRQVGFPAGFLSGTLLKLELMGLVKQVPGKYFFK